MLFRSPSGTTYVSGGDSVTGDGIYWTLSIGPGQTVQVSYTVSVNNVPNGTVIDGNDAKVGGVMHRCAAIKVMNTLTATEQQAIKDALDALALENTTLKGLELVNEIYKRALGKSDVFKHIDVNDVMDGCDDSIFYQTATVYSGKPMDKLRNEDTYYKRMLVDHLYGGQRVDSAAKLYDRTKMLKPHNLIVGDVLVARTNAAESVYIYIGDGYLINLTNGVGVEADFANLSQRIMFYGRNFAVVRPSFVID